MLRILLHIIHVNIVKAEKGGETVKSADCVFLHSERKRLNKNTFFLIG